jgi:thiol-disulfide isomerase/thioredoxin
LFLRSSLKVAGCCWSGLRPLSQRLSRQSAEGQTAVIVRYRSRWLAFLAGMLIPIGPLLAALPAEPEIDPAARQLLEATAQAYHALTAYTDHGSVQLAMAIEGRPFQQSLPLALTFARPNKLVIDAGSLRLTCDGTKLTTANSALKTFNVTPAPAKLSLDTLIDNPLGAFVFSGPTSRPISVILNLLWSDDAARILLEHAAGLKPEDDRKVDDRDCKVLLIDEKQGPSLRLLLDSESKLIRRIELVFDPDELAQVKGNTGATDVSVAWNAGAIATDVPDEKAFAFEVPAGFTQVADLASRRAPGAKRKDPLEEWLGKPAPDFTLTVLDGPDKTRQLSKADLLGKVVILDFWATWCPPCMAELPEIQKLVDQYAKKNANGVIVVALSQDSEAGEMVEIRKLVEQTLSARELKLAEGPGSLVALDPLRTIGKAFSVTAIPTVVILDAKGIVQAVRVGFEPDVLDTLTNDVDTLLEGRSLVTPKPAEANAPGAGDRP